MSDRNNFDTLDILAGAVGVVIAFTLLPYPVDRLTERIVVPLTMLMMVTVKRFCIPTKEPNSDSNAGIRMTYLFIAFIGTICLGLSLLAMFVDLQEYSEPVVITTLLGSGISLLVIASFIDRRWLKK